MKKSNLRFLQAWMFLLAVMLTWHQGRTAPAVFTLVSNQSQLTLSGTVVYGSLSAPVTTQASGSLTTSFIGGINTELDGSNIVFTGDSVIDALTNGSWQPAPGGAAGTTALGDYGGKATVAFIVTAYGTLREVGMDITSPALDMTNGMFSARDLVFSFIPVFLGSLDYAATTGESGSALLSGNATNLAGSNASLTTTGGVQRLFIPVDVTYPIGSGALAGTTLRFAGQIVATRLLPPLITQIVVTNHSAVITVANASLQAQLQSSTNLFTWSAAGAAVSNANGLLIFTTPATEPIQFFRVQNWP